MKRKTLIIIISILIFASFAPNKLVSVKGRIVSQGNEPFTYPVIVTEKNQVIKIKEGNFSKKELFSYQGKHILVSGYVDKEKVGKNTEYYIDIEEIKILED